MSRKEKKKEISYSLFLRQYQDKEKCSGKLRSVKLYPIVLFIMEYLRLTKIKNL